MGPTGIQEWEGPAARRQEQLDDFWRGRGGEMRTCDLSEQVRSESQGQVAASMRISLGFCNYKLLIEHNKKHQESSH